MKHILRTIAGISMLASTSALASLIDFETNAAGNTPIDNELVGLTDVFNVGSVAISFGFDSNGDGTLDSPAVFEEAGNTDAGGDTGFLASNGRDIAEPGFETDLGRFFLRQQMPYLPFGTFVITYSSLDIVTAASGEIWDIDGKINKTEQFTVKAYNGSSLLQTIVSPTGTDLTLDGQPWTFGFTGLPNLTKIEISFTGTKTNGIGLAFNNFSPVTSLAPTTNVSEPFGLWLLTAPLLIILARKLLRRKGTSNE